MRSCMSFAAVAARFAFSVRAMSVLVFAQSDECKSEMVFMRVLTYCRLAGNKKIIARGGLLHHSEVSYNREVPHTQKVSCIREVSHAGGCFSYPGGRPYLGGLP